MHTIGGPLPLKDIFASHPKPDINKEKRLATWDRGVFLNELERQDIVAISSNESKSAESGLVTPAKGLQHGTYGGTQLALTEFYKIMAEANTSEYSVKGLETTFPVQRSLKQKQTLYQWSDPDKDHYPPHILKVPTVPWNENIINIFDLPEALNVNVIAKAFSYSIPWYINLVDGTPFKGPTLADCEAYNTKNPSGPHDIMKGKNIADLGDWYSDARFAQQHLSGVNPTTIEAVPQARIQEYIDEAGNQGLDSMKSLLSTGQDLLMQDCSYFREATGVSNEEVFQNTFKVPGGKFNTRYACASVVIFQLHSDGRLHPLAITLDYKGSLANSITIFNKRLNPDDKGPVDEKEDWPWRYAKTCAQTADWSRHELAVHLVDTHLIEEAIIVASHRTLDDNSLIYKLLRPHWFRTLPLNDSARSILVPKVIERLAGFGVDPTTGLNRVYGFINSSYKNFNFQDKYIPNDFKKRGFNIEGETGDKYRNYPYAYIMYYLWKFIREFVAEALATQYKSDEAVQADSSISAWCTEIQTKGQITSFPTITTVDQLVDAVTMCIHIASPQHTAVNYLQHYYYSFVPSKPPALCAPLPADLETLNGYKEEDLTAALPIGNGPQWQDWLLAAQLPELLSYQVDQKYNLITYAQTLYMANSARVETENKSSSAQALKDAAEKFYNNLKGMDYLVKYVSANQTPGTVPYNVLEPELTAVSILI